MSKFEDIKAGDPVRLVYEGAVEYISGDIMYIAGCEFTAGESLVSVERPLPTEFGWYEAKELPLSDGFSPYRLTGYGWRDAEGGDVPLDTIKEIAPMYKLGRIEQ